ncbi:MAG: hypothetical protein ACYDH6_11615 [Acidimicrobiales bacterium]
MKHAGTDALDKLEPLLRAVRSVDGIGLREKSRGVFYRSSKAFLHFHEDPDGFFADVRIDEEFERFRVTSAAEQRALVQLLRSLGR